MTNSQKNTIIIIGDWIVDEYWFLARHHSDISNHTGFIHYRISSNSKEHVKGLCGAGHVASVLYQTKKNTNAKLEFLGIGKWNERDSIFIKHLIHSYDNDANCPASKTNYLMTPQFCTTPPEIELITLNKNSYTTRVVRQYRYENGGIEQINRIDWEPEHSSENKKEKISLQMNCLPDNVKQIVVFDFLKGGISNNLIDKLKNKYSSAKWFVRSKQKKPHWLTKIKNSLEINMVGPEVAVRDNPWENWLWKGKITDRAKELLKSIPGKNVIIVSNNLDIIIRTDSIHGEKLCFTGNSGIEPTIISQLGWPSAFFASLAYKFSNDKFMINEKDLEDAIKTADNYSGHRMLNKQSYNPEQRDIQIKRFIWKNEVKDCINAGKDCGILSNNNGDMRLELWRGSSALPNYITCINKKQDILNHIGQKLRSFFNNENPIRSLCILLQADPGSGKTHLAKRLAQAFDFSFIRFDITQMTAPDELLDLFDDIATKQAESNKKVLVFIDEFNSPVKGNKVYSSFLTPLEEGIYRRKGKFFSLKPCVWIFAGTKVKIDKEKENKYSDFLSRMDIIEKIDYKSFKSAYKKHPNKLKIKARLEQVYLGVTMIKNFFPDVHNISLEVLKQFQKLNPEEAPARKIRKLASSLRNVQYGRISKTNCEDWENISWRKKPKTKDKKFVEIL